MGFNFLLIVIIGTPFLSVAFLKDPFLLCARGLSLLLRLFFGVSTVFYSFKLFKFFRVSRIYIVFRGFLFSLLICISTLNFFSLLSVKVNVKRYVFCVKNVFSLIYIQSLGDKI